MIMLMRHLMAVALLPFVVTVVVPAYLARENGIVPALGDSWPKIATQIAGLLVFLVGLTLFLSSLRRFATQGKGTLAPWDPPRNLVVQGPYRYVRNPMISGVVCVLIGEALVLLSVAHLMWALAFLAANLIYIPLAEEPQLESRFGAAYVAYRQHVPRLLPRLHPWQPQDQKDSV